MTINKGEDIKTDQQRQRRKKVKYFYQTTAALAVMGMLFLGGCGKDQASKSSSEAVRPDTQASSAPEEGGVYSASSNPLLDLPLVQDGYKLEDCITLANYKNIPLHEPKQEVTEEEVIQYINSNSTPEEVTDKDAAIRQEDRVNLDYEGKIDGKAFDGGSAKNYDLTIGSGTFIEGFEEQLIGMKKDESADIHVTFPKDYRAEDLAGKEAVFTVKIHSISRVPELTDEWVQDSTHQKYKTVDEYKKAMEQELKKQKMIGTRDAQQQEIWDRLIRESTFKALPETEVEKQKELLKKDLEMAANASNVTPEEFLKQSGMDRKTYESQTDFFARIGAQLVLVKKAVVEAEGLDEKSEEYQAALKELMDTAQSTEEELIKSMGEETIWKYCMEQAIFERIKSYARITTETSEG